MPLRHDVEQLSWLISRMGGPLQRVGEFSCERLPHTSADADTKPETDQTGMAARVFERHPHFAVFSNKNSVEIIECLEMPTPETAIVNLRLET